MMTTKTSPLARIGTKLTDGGKDHLWDFHLLEYVKNKYEERLVEVVAFTLGQALRVFYLEYGPNKYWIEGITHNREKEK